jgi:hemoglobin
VTTAEPDSAPTPSAYDLLGGEPALRAIVDRFYDLMELEPGYRTIRALHPADLSGSRDKLFWFLSGWLGGPALYVQRFGHPRLRARHLPYSIGVAERDQWMACMEQALAESGVRESVRNRLVEAFYGTADWMRNRSG